MVPVGERRETVTEAFGAGEIGNLGSDMMREPNDERIAVLAVLAAAAREAEELLEVAEVWEDVCPEALQEADRRLKLFMQTSGRSI